jgi:DNA end-binding protein Ku
MHSVRQERSLCRRAQSTTVFVHDDAVIYFANPYYIVPDGEAGVQAFAVIRDAIEEESMMALGRVVFTSREHVIGPEPRGKGIMGITLRYPYEVRDEKDYFDDIPSERVTEDMLDLAKHIIKTKTGHFHPEKFEDQYEDALKDLLRKKGQGRENRGAKVYRTVLDQKSLSRAAPSVTLGSIMLAAFR